MKFGFAEKARTCRRRLGRFQKNSEKVSPTRRFSWPRGSHSPSLHPDLPLWQEKLYAFMTRNAVRAPDYFLIPPARVVELGTKVEM